MELKIEVMFYVYDKEFNKRIEKHYTTVDRLCYGRDNFKYNQVDVIAKRLFTGVKDQADVEIYNGDIFESFGDLAVVFYSEQNASFRFKYIISGYEVEPLGNYSAVAYKVIGNIYENPELLEV